MHRRTFLKSTAFGSLSSVALASAAAVHVNNANDVTRIILFQGDSITDGNRSRNNDWNHVLGHGYAFLIASHLWYNWPDAGFKFYNRGISGNKVPDLLSRWETDTIPLQPTVLSILVGINDVAAGISGDKNFTSASYERDYRQLLQESRAALPDTQLVICEPFILPVGKVKAQWQVYEEQVTLRQAVTRRLAAEFNGIHVPFQSAFNDALQRAPADFWIWDGIHPMPAGHELMARTWIKAVGEKLDYIRI